MSEFVIVAAMNRREFIRTMGMTGLAILALKTFGCSSGGDYFGTEFYLKISAALFEMIDGEKIYMWAFGDSNSLPQMPGPVIEVSEGDQVRIHITNSLSTGHAFAVPGVVESAVIPPGSTIEVTFTAPAAGSYMYLDPTNAPVNRVLGLHGAMIVLPKSGNSPYSSPTAGVAQLFDDLGTTAHFPKHALSPAGWQSDRSRIWLMSQVDPLFNSRVENGETIDPDDMKQNFLPQYFTINGKSGVFAAHDPSIMLTGRIGEPMLVRQMNAGLFTHSNHLHANHFYVTSVNNVIQENVLALDTHPLAPLNRVDWLVPYVRPPDIAGDENTPIRELIPNELDLVIGGNEGVLQSPLVYPMHCHVETSQTAAGGNYPQGSVAHFEFTGDIDGVDFPTS